MKFTYSLMVVVFMAAVSVGMASAQHMHDKAAAVDSNSGHQMFNSELMHKCMMQSQMMDHEMMREAATKKSSQTKMMKMVPMGMKLSAEETPEEESSKHTMSNIIRCVMDGMSSDPFLNAVIKLFALPIVRTDPGLSDEQIVNLISMQQRVLEEYEAASRLISQSQGAIRALESVGESSRTDIEALESEIDAFRERRQGMILESSGTMTAVLTDDQIESFEAYSIEDMHHNMMAELSNEEMTLLMRIIHCDMMSSEMMHDGEGMEMMHDGEGMEMMHDGEGMEMMHDGEGMEMMKDCPMQAKSGHRPSGGESKSENHQ